MNEFMRRWMSERDEAVRTAFNTDDLRVFKRFYAKYKAKGIYKLPIPDDKVLKISLCKAICMMRSATPEEKRRAAGWLQAHGYSYEDLIDY